MTAVGNPIEAILTLDATNFHLGIDTSVKAVDKFKRSIDKFSGDASSFEANIRTVLEAVENLSVRIVALNSELGDLSNLKSFGQFLKNTSTAILNLSNESNNLGVGIERVNALFDKWATSIGSTTVKVEGMASAVRQLIREENESSNETNIHQQRLANLRNSYTTTVNALYSLGKALNSEKASYVQVTNAMKQYELGQTNVAQSIRNSLNAFNSQYMTFEKVNAEAIKSREALLLYRNELMNLALGVEQFNAIETGNTAHLQENQSALSQVALADERVARLKQELAMAMNEETGATEKNTSANEKNTQSMERQSTASKKLGKSMSSLKMMGTMVASMFVYNFAHNLLTATRETVNAKSEMNGYFQMLGYSSREVDHFNSKLDEMIQKFPRINKYALGETISSIGVEFELTTKEMEKAMPVVSMITSEYLRAGRNVNEASLAVKDILQGEFQRLSRETGVKEKNLTEAGWSGDKSDVMGLLKALKKVGEDRNWDIFVAKANSLNDAVIILQNRFGEWSADMVEKIQPSIVNAFNQIMTVAQLLGGAVNGVIDFISGNSIASGIVTWGGLATAVSSVTFAYIHQRTGAGLLQIAQMGLKDSIIATALSLDAEVVAEEGSTFAIAQRITGLEAETIAEMGSKTAIFSKIVGLDMETVAEHGLKTAILSTVLGIEAETLANEGLLSSLMANKVAVAGLVVEIGALVGVLGILAVAFGNVAMEVIENTEKMKSFHNLANNGDAVLKEYKGTISSVKDKLKDLKDTQSRYTKGSKEYIKTGKAITQLENLITDAKSKRKTVEEAIKIAEDSQKGFDEAKAQKRLDYEQKIHQSLVDTKLTTEEVETLSNQYLRQATDGAELLSEATQRLDQDYRSSAEGIADAVNEMENMNLTTTEMVERVRELSSANDFIIKGEIQMAEAENLTEYLSGWATKQYGEVTITLSNLKFDIEHKTLQEALEGLVKGVVYGIAGIFGKSGDEVRKLMEEEMNAQDMTSWTEALIWGIMPFDDLENLGLEAPNLTGYIGDWIVSLLQSVDWDSINQSITDALNQINSFDPSGFVQNIINGIVGEFQLHLGNVWVEMFQPLIQGITVDFPNYITSSFGRWSEVLTGLYDIVKGVFGSIYDRIKSFMSSIGQSVYNGFQYVYTTATTKINQARDSVSNAIHQLIDAFIHMKDSILNSAKKIQDGVKEKFDSVKDTISGFYDKLTNPSKWLSGGGYPSWSRTPKPQTARRLFSPVVSRTTGKHGAGINPYQSSPQVTLNDLVARLGGDKRVDLAQFLSLFVNSGFGAWDFHDPVLKKTFNTAKGWKADAPSWNGITMGNGYQVGRFWDGKPKFTWDDFMATAKAVFSAIPYKFYMDSDWKGDWLSALLSGATNCHDGSMALLALARLFGFEGHMVHTNLKNGVGHFFVNIAGHNLDTTNFQNNSSWKPLGGAGIPVRHSNIGGGSYATSNKNTTINVEISGNVYGVDDLESKIEEGVKKGLRAEFNDPYTVAI